MKQHTPGPWEWRLISDGALTLVHPFKGMLIVMDFVRRGMRGAEPRFATWNGDERANMGGIMVPVSKMQNPADHPDLRLIAAAPELLAACKAWDEGFVDGEQFTPEQFRVWVNERRKMAREAVAKTETTGAMT